MNQHSNPWTPERDAELRAHWASGISSLKIGEAMGISKNSVIGRVHRLDLPKRAPVCNVALAPVSERQRAMIRNLWLSEPLKVLSRMTGLDHRRIKRLAAEMDLPSKSCAVVARPAARVPSAPLVKDTRAASPSRLGAATFSRAFSSRAVERLGASTQVENLPSAAADEALRRVFSDRQCSFVLTSTGRQHRYCDEPCVANERGRPSPYCPDHYAICIIGAPGPNMPPIFKWRD